MIRTFPVRSKGGGQYAPATSEKTEKPYSGGFPALCTALMPLRKEALGRKEHTRPPHSSA